MSTDLTFAADELRSLFHQMGESSAAAMEALANEDADSAAASIEQRGTLTRKIEALLPDLIHEHSTNPSAVENLLIGVRMAAESVQLADRELAACLEHRCGTLANELDDIDDKMGAHSAYSADPASRKASINVVR